MTECQRCALIDELLVSAMIKIKELKEANQALRDALRVRIDYKECPDCGGEFGQTGHAETCRHYATEHEVMQ